MLSTDRSQWETIFTDPASWRESVEAILAQHGLGPLHTLRAGYPGSHAVFIANERLVIKLYAPFWGETAPLERAVLQAVTQAEIVGVPRLHAAGQHHAAGHAWPYLVMDFLAGERLGALWPTLRQSERDEVARHLGRIARGLHRLPLVGPTAPLPAAFGPRADWTAFLAHQMANVVAHHTHTRPGSLPPHLLADLPTYLAAARPLLDPTSPLPWDPTAPRLALLHGDLTADHALLSPRASGGWQVSGLIDFGDARLGDPLYDFVALAFDALDLDALAIAQLCHAYGWADAPQYPAFRRALLALALLHEYADLRSPIARAGGPDAVETLSDLEARFLPPL